MKVEIRAKNNATIQGYVNVVERESREIPSVRGKFREIVREGTFEKALQANKNVELRFNHSRKLGSQAGGELELKVDNVGLYAKATVTDEEVIQKAKNGELRGWSFGFVCKDDEWKEDRRFLNDIALKEVSILSVTPAYKATSIESRDAGEELAEFRSIDAEVIVSEEVEEEPAEERKVDGMAFDVAKNLVFLNEME